MLLYAFGVYPLSQRVANVPSATRRPAQALVAAREENGTATGTLTGKDRAVTELATFYTAVLPQDLAERAAPDAPAPRRSWRASTGCATRERQSEPVAERDSTLTRLKTDVSLAGSYVEIRSFVHELETAPEFVVIDNVAAGRRQRRRAKASSSRWPCPRTSGARCEP